METLGFRVMTAKWVDNEFYFGPDRRKGEGRKRWGNRRIQNDAAEPPPLGAVLRRLRVLMTDLSTADDRSKALRLANLAQAEAETRRLLKCADHIREAARLIMIGDGAGADAHIVEAQAIASAQPR